MDDLASKLMSLGQRQNVSSAAQPSAIFGSASSLSKSVYRDTTFRVGVWPCIGQQQPEIAMGLMTAIALLLERWRDVRVYRIFTKYDAIDDGFIWSIAQSQFSVEDWTLDTLDENIVLSGTLNQEHQVWHLGLEIENDLVTSETNVLLKYQSTSLVGLYNTLNEIADDIIKEIGANGRLIKFNASTECGDINLGVFLRRLFRWQIDLNHALMLQTVDEDHINESLEELIEAANAVNDELSAWLVAATMSHAMLPGYGEIANVVFEYSEAKVEKFDKSLPIVYATIASGYHRFGEPQSSYDLLEKAIRHGNDNALIWRTLAELYQLSARSEDAIDTLQRAIENDITDTSLYVKYADLILSLDFEGIDLEEFIFIDPDEDEVEQNAVLWEAIEAYESALAIDGNDPAVLQKQVARLIDVGGEDSRLWSRFASLVEIDTSGERVRSIVDSSYTLDDLEPLIKILEKHQPAHEINVPLLLNLAVAFIISEESDDALATLEKAKMATDDPKLIAEIDRLTLEAEDFEFDAKITEYVQILDAGRTLRNKDVDYLEDILERIPSLAEIWVIVAKAYIAWEDKEAALETLIDGYQYVPESPELSMLLGQVLWDMGQTNLALNYLEKGIQVNPFDVPLLSKIGLFLFESKQREEAKQFLEKAEMLAPRHPELVKTRSRISTILASESR